MTRRARLLLFDVDGTLLSPGPRARAAFASALADVFGTSGNLETFAFEGKLDPFIVSELMREAGVAEKAVAEGLPRALDLYLDRLEAALALERPRTKPGVPELLERVATNPSAVTALLTGNVERGARIKLSAAGLWHRFRFGVFGDEASRREELGPVALSRARATTGIAFTGPDCVVVGDARQDVACGRAIGARVVAVATGKTPAAELSAAGADVVLPDFGDLDAAVEALLG
ncbi:MAG TPA: haloacid dehalogenase-like hydrolase [Thermoanaerobaculia bacterium]|nr:haloacid dehalogenase-like hydrolase [Thermoanaerobaculia bacterium]